MAKHPGGRPTKYKPEYIDKVDEYLAMCEDQYYDYVKGDGPKGNTYERRVSVKLPTREGFSQFIDVSLSTVKEWYDIPEFSSALRKIDVEQHKRLIDGALSSDYNSTIAKLILSSNHGYKERVDGTSGDKPVQQDVDLSQLDTDTLEKLLKARKK
jgi:hypothetical protein